MTMYRRMALAIVMLVAVTTSIAAQTDTPAQSDPQKARPRTTQEKKDEKTTMEPADAARTPSDPARETQGNPQGQSSEEDEFKPYYNNFFSTYRLGPEDVISVEVFNQERYSRKGIIVPPNGRISLSLIPGGVFVNGKTTAEVEEIIKKRYDEFIIN